MGIISRWKERRRQKRKLREWRNLAQAYATLDMFSQKGLIEWAPKQRQLYIDSNLALLMMRDAKSWQHFIGGVYTWIYDKECRKAWDDFIRREGLKAVREVSKTLPKGKTLSRRDIERIRDARRSEIAQGDMKPPKVEGFEFFVVKPPVLNENANENEKPLGQPVGQLISVGHYDPDTEQMEMALWRDVEPMLKANHS